MAGTRLPLRRARHWPAGVALGDARRGGRPKGGDERGQDDGNWKRRRGGIFEDLYVIYVYMYMCVYIYI